MNGPLLNTCRMCRNPHHSARNVARAGNEGQQGAALIAVLVIMLIIAGVVAASSRLSVKSAISGRRFAAECQADILARSAMAPVWQALAQGRNRNADFADAPWAESFGENGVHITIRPANAVLDLNEALQDPEIAKAIGRRLESMNATTDALDALLDWIDKDTSERIVGSEGRLYDDRFPAYTPRNGPLQTVEEARLIAGWEGLTPEQIREAFTVWSEEVRVNVNFVDRDTLESLFPDQPDLYASVRSAQENGGVQNTTELMQLVERGGAEYRVSRYLTAGSDRYEVYVTVDIEHVQTRYRFILDKDQGSAIMPPVARMDRLWTIPERNATESFLR